MRSAFVTPTTAMLFSTLDFAFFRRQKSKVSNLRTSRPLHGAISNTSRNISFWSNSGEIGDCLVSQFLTKLQADPAVDWSIDRSTALPPTISAENFTAHWTSDISAVSSTEYCTEVHWPSSPELLWIYRWLHHGFNISNSFPDFLFQPFTAAIIANMPPTSLLPD